MCKSKQARAVSFLWELRSPDHNKVKAEHSQLISSKAYRKPWACNYPMASDHKKYLVFYQYLKNVMDTCLLCESTYFLITKFMWH